MTETNEQSISLNLVAEIVTAYVSNNDLPTTQLTKLAERGVRSHGVVMTSPAFNHDLGLHKRVEDLTIEQLIPGEPPEGSACPASDPR